MEAGLGSVSSCTGWRKVVSKLGAFCDGIRSASPLAPGTWRPKSAPRKRGAPGLGRHHPCQLPAQRDRWDAAGQERWPVRPLSAGPCLDRYLIGPWPGHEILRMDPTVWLPGAETGFAFKGRRAAQQQQGTHHKSCDSAPAPPLALLTSPQCPSSSPCRATRMPPNSTSSRPGKAKRRGARTSTFPRSSRAWRSSTTR